ncbi:hypothetical protein F1B92_05940 [Campylobacter sp. FMV-PI01]|uniref:Uncharacterized protein n=1 Tax=Campylobacter portucalensis TaxID=2608384 RepID=A0A6L5WI17_9BACT|nr:hypothetical protein [Campylobacter portucalensis]MSN96704.1 hypothetical protein [Campylobacter portucalensis]
MKDIMKKNLVLAILMVFGSLTSYAKDLIFYHDIDEALKSNFAKKMLVDEIGLEFSQKYDLDEREAAVLTQRSTHFFKNMIKNKQKKILTKKFANMFLYRL